MSLTSFALSRRAVVFAAAAIVLVGGLLTFKNMSRREDPEILIRSCVVVTQWPGTPAKKVEELVTDPLEKKLLELSEVKNVKSDSLTGQSVITVDIEDEYTSLEQIWDKVRNKVADAQPQLPQGCGAPWVNSDFGDVYAVVLALRQAPGAEGAPASERYSYRQLEVFSERVQDALKALGSVAKVELYGVPREEISVEVQSGEWSQLGLTSQDLGKLLDARNIVEPGGSLDTEAGRYPITPSGEFASVDQMGDVVVGSHDGAPVRLRDVPLEIRRGYQWPQRHIARFRTADEDPERAVFLSISMKGGRNVVAMGEEIEACVKGLIGAVIPPDIRITRANDLPRQVDTKIKDFVVNLGQSILIVLVVAWLMMGWRPALVMAAAIPLSMIAAILVVSKIGVELEQFSIASLIIALGMVVDNAIVISDNVVRLMGAGRSKVEAALEGAAELAGPVMASTATTVAAFLPLAFMSGGSGEYIRSLPIVVSATLVASYVIAMTVTPLMCIGLLKAPDPDVAPKEPSAFGKGYERLVTWCLNHKAIVLGLAAAAFVASLQLIPLIGSQFFPAGDRDQFFIDVWLPEGKPISATDDVVRQVMDMIVETRMRPGKGGEAKDCLVSAVSFVGGSPPRMSLTMETEQTFANFASLVVNTSDPKASAAWARELAEKVQTISGADVTVRPFMLGPSIKYPVEFRLVGDDDALIRAKGEEMVAALRATPGTSRVWTNWGNSSCMVSVDVDPQAANLAGVSNHHVAQTLNSLVSGGYLTTYREGDHQVPTLLRLRQEERSRLDDLGGMYVTGSKGKVPLDSIATLNLSWQPAKISRRDNRRTLTIAARVAPGELPNIVTARAHGKLKEILATLPPSYELQVGGEQEETAESNEKIVGAFGIGFCLIVLVLITQYNSLTKPLVILAAVPLALIGALLGLYLSGWALGFMPSLGIVSLAGVVINNAIVLIDFIESKVADGEEFYPAVAESGRIRMAPIVLTTLTTVGGMLPLALFGGPMWAGMAWVVIVGLAVSTVLTLLVVPTLFTAVVEIFGLAVGGVDLKARAAGALVPVTGPTGAGPTEAAQAEAAQAEAAKAEAAKAEAAKAEVAKAEAAKAEAAKAEAAKAEAAKAEAAKAEAAKAEAAKAEAAKAEAVRAEAAKAEAAKAEAAKEPEAAQEPDPPAKDPKTKPDETPDETPGEDA
jgi:multidrug efflux pump subunit AcrB